MLLPVEPTQGFILAVAEENPFACWRQAIHSAERIAALLSARHRITKDGRLSAKDIYNKEILRDLQTDMPLYLQSKGFVIERGEENSKGVSKKP